MLSVGTVCCNESFVDEHLVCCCPIGLNTACNDIAYNDLNPGPPGGAPGDQFACLEFRLDIGGWTWAGRHA